MDFEEKKDPQYVGLRRVIRTIPPKALLEAALVCYRLSATGEEYWQEVFDFYEENPFANFLNFFAQSRTNRMAFHLKKRRLTRLDGFSLRWDETPLNLYKRLATMFNPYQKTVAFAVKMFGYGRRIYFGRREPFPFEVPIPVDSRVLRITVRLTAEEPISFWQRIAQKSGVPALHIDSILWNRGLPFYISTKKFN